MVGTFMLSANTIFADKDVSIGFGNSIVSSYDFEERYGFVKDTYSKFNISLESNEKLNTEIRETLAHKMIAEDVNAEIAKELKVSVKGSEVDEYMKKHKFKSKDQDVYSQKQMVENFLLQNKIVNKLLSEVDYSDEQIQYYFEENKKSYIKPANVQFEQVVFKDKKTADNLMKKFNKKTALNDFKESKDVIVFSGEMDKREESALSEQIFSLKVGEWSELIEVGEEYHLYKVLKSNEEGVYSFDEIKEKVIEDYMIDKANYRFGEMINKTFEEKPPYVQI